MIPVRQARGVNGHRLIHAPAWCEPAMGILAAVLAASVPIAAAKAAPVDAHVYAEDTAREVAVLVKPGTALIVDAPDSYYQMAVVAQLEAKVFLVATRSITGGIPVRFLLVDVGHGGAAKVDLVVGATTVWRTYERLSGKPSGTWTKQVSPTPVDQTLNEPGQLYQLGRAVENQSPDRAMQYYRLAAALGHKEADLRLGLMLIANGKAEEGMRFITVASDAGNAQAAYVLGLAYLNGTGIAKNSTSGRALLRKAAEAGIVAASQALGGQASSR